MSVEPMFLTYTLPAATDSILSWVSEVSPRDSIWDEPDDWPDDREEEFDFDDIGRWER